MSSQERVWHEQLDGGYCDVQCLFSMLIQLLPKPSLTPGAGETAMSSATVRSPEFGEPRARNHCQEGMSAQER